MRISTRIRGAFLGIGAAVALAAMPVVSSAGVFIGVSVNIAPPAIPVYVQPPCPEPGYLWVPGYWAWGADGYYWVPGTWVLPPSVGLVWTPGYWGWVGGAYLWHAGYWGPHVGFYGGVNYGFGYPGVGFVGGYWRSGVFFYNRAVANVTHVHVTNVYYRPVVNNIAVTRVSYNGGPGGVIARPTRMDLDAARERHVAFAPMQRQQMQFAAHNRALLASANGGRPAVAATMRPGSQSRFAERPAPRFNQANRAEFDRGRAQRFAQPPAQRYREQPQMPRYREQPQMPRYREQPQMPRYREPPSRGAPAPAPGRGQPGGERGRGR